MPESPKLEVYFEDKRFRMTVAGRFVVRVIGYVSYIVVLAAALTFIASDLPWLVWFGVLLSLFLVDRYIHRADADRSFAEIPSEGVINLAHYVAPRAFLVVERAYDHGSIAHGDVYLSILNELLRIDEVKDVLRRLEVPREEIRQRLEELLHEQQTASVAGAAREGGVETLMVEAFKVAQAGKHHSIESTDLFAALLRIDHPGLQRLFQMFTIDAGDAERAALFSRIVKEMGSFRARPRVLGGVVPGALRGPRHRIMNRAWTSRPTPVLDSVSVDFTDLARQGVLGFLIGHEHEYDHLIQALSRPTNPNALLIGEPSSGREAIVSHLAFALTKDRVPKELFDRRLVSLNVTEVLAMANRDSLEGMVTRIVNEIVLAGNIILYIPDFHTLLSGESGAHLSLADAFLNLVQQGVCPVIGATFPREYKQYIEPRTAVAGAFEVIHVEEISVEDAERILTHEAVILEKDSKISITFAAIKKAVEVGKKYVRDTLLPTSALELLRDAVKIASREGSDAVHPDHVVQAAETKTNVPIHEVGTSESEALLNLEETIHHSYVDQEEAVTAVADALREYRSGIARKNGPIASFLFVGPTGVGKTELAKMLAKIQFGSEHAMLRFDMSEYQDKASFSRFIGSPDGSQRGVLTEAVREKPYSVVLLDEFEKAFPDITNLFLQVLDDGRLTDTLDRVIDFKNTIIIATSNAHSDYVIEAVGRGESIRSIADTLKKQLVSVFRPELINRFSKVIVFKNLSRPDVQRIAELQLNQFGKDLGGQGIGFSITPGAIMRVSELGYDPQYGARPLRQVIEEQIRAPLAKKLLAKELRRGGTLTVDVQDGTIVFR